MLQKIIFPLSHETYRSCPIKPEEQLELASSFGLPIERIQQELNAMAQAMREGELVTPRTTNKLRRFVRAKIERDLKPKGPSAKQRIQAFQQSPGFKFAVFRRSASGRSANFQVLHDTYEKALEVARTHAAENAGDGHSDFTFYVVEIKHRVGIEDGKLVDAAVM
jgi:hypothetical protein